MLQPPQPIFTNSISHRLIAKMTLVEIMNRFLLITMEVKTFLTSLAVFMDVCRNRASCLQGGYF